MKINTAFLVDDDGLFQFLAKRVIEETKLVDRIEIFSNGQEALDHLKALVNNPAKLPDIILLDLNMPVMDGWNFLKEFSKLAPQLGRKITTYIVSSSNDPADINRSQQFDEVKDFIIKPITKQKFIEMVEGM